MARKWDWTFTRKTLGGPIYAHGTADDQQNAFVTLTSDQEALLKSDKQALADQLTADAEAKIAPPPPPIVPEEVDNIKGVDADEAAVRIAQKAPAAKEKL